MGDDVTKMMMPTPANLSAGKARMVDSDLYNICGRIKEVDPRLALVYHQNHERPWVVMERGLDNVDRFVSRYEEIGAHILDDLRYMLRVPYDKRLEAMEKRVEAENKAASAMDEAALDKFLFQFDKAARDSNLYTPMWSKSMRNIKALKKQGKNGSD